MVSKNPRISKSGVTTTGRFPLYSNSPEINDADPSLVRVVRGNSLSAVYLSGGSLASDDIGGFEDLVADNMGDTPEDDSDSNSDVSRYGVPSNSDISIVSNTVVYDAAGNPSVTLIFKVKNSSGESLKGMNAKVEIA
jgi:hypothetical protein